MKRLNLIPFAVFCLFVSCNNTAPNQLWLFSSLHNPDVRLEESFSPVSFLWLSTNGNYSRDFGTYEYGTWKKSGDSLFLTDSENKTSAFSMIADKKVLRLSVSEHTFFTFNYHPLNDNDSTANPFLPEYNKWRIKAATQENDSSLVERLANHCKFWEIYFTWAEKNELPSIDVRSLPTPIKIYSNGFTLKPVTKKWAKYFFDEKDAWRSNEILEDIIRNNKINWPSGDRKYAMFISAFRQMQTFLRDYSTRIV